MAILPISDVINVSIENVPQGLTQPNVNSVMLFSNETPVSPILYGAFQEYVSASQVATDWGTNSVMAQMANAIFSQQQNPLSGGGHLVIAPLINSVSATAGQIETADISANLANLIAVTNGDLKVTVNGIVYNLENLNLSIASTLAQVASIIDAALPSGISVIASSTQMTFVSDKVGLTSSVALAAYSGGGTDLSGTTYLHAGTATATAGANSTGETILAAIARTSGLVGYAAVITNLNLEDAAISTIAAGIQALDNVFLHHCSSTTDIPGICTTISTAEETKTRLLTYLVSQAAANLYKAAYTGRGFSTDYTGSNTVGTMNLQQLATIVPDPGMTQTLRAAANIAGTDVYVNYAGVPAVYSTQGNDYFDNVYANLALKFALETAGFNYLAGTLTKVPQTEPGMNGLKAAYIAVMEQFVINGELAPGAWNSSETFGPNPQTFLNNVAQNGYYVYSAPVAQQSSSDRNARKAPLVQIAAKRSGAIQSSDVIVLINN